VAKILHWTLRCIAFIAVSRSPTSGFWEQTMAILEFYFRFCNPVI